MTIFLYGITLTLLLFAVLKVALSFLRRVFPEGHALFESMENYLWIPAALLALMLTALVARMEK